MNLGNKNENMLWVVLLYLVCILLHNVGASQEILDKLQTYQSDLSKDIDKLFQLFDLPHVKKTRMGIIHNIFRIFGTDHKINSEELEFIYIMAKKLGATKEQVQQIQNLYEEEDIIILSFFNKNLLYLRIVFAYC